MMKTLDVTIYLLFSLTTYTLSLSIVIVVIHHPFYLYTPSGTLFPVFDFQAIRVTIHTTPRAHMHRCRTLLHTVQVAIGSDDEATPVTEKQAPECSS
jgi:hypothetical protein